MNVFWPTDVMKWRLTIWWHSASHLELETVTNNVLAPSHIFLRKAVPSYPAVGDPRKHEFMSLQLLSTNVVVMVNVGETDSHVHTHKAKMQTLRCVF